jgi:cell division protein FtsL
MLKLLLCLFCGTATAVAMLELREQHLNLTFQTDKLHNQLEASQAQLWNQQLSIAVATAPDAVAAAAKGQDLKLTAGRAPMGPGNKQQ